MPDSLSTLLVVVFTIAAVVGGYVRFRYVVRRRLDVDELEEKGDLLLFSWRQVARDPNTDLPMTASAWHTYGVTNLEAIELARYLSGRGQIVLPNYSLIALLMGEPPTVGRLTQNSWERFGPSGSNLTINGPANFGTGTQINSGTFSYTWTDVERDFTALAFELRNLIRATEPGPEREQLERAVAVVDGVVEEKSPADARVKPVLKWLSTFAQDSASGSVGGVIGNLATRLLGTMLGWQ